MEVKTIINELNKHGITNKLEQAHLLAQCDHESAGFTKLAEGTKYRFKTARATFCGNLKLIEHQRRLAEINKKQLEIKAKDDDFCPQPWLFNLVYGSRMGNEKNGTNDNDGADYAGAGLLQLTGRDNYLAFLSFANMNGHKLTIDTVDDFVRTPQGAILSAIWFWTKNAVGELARKDDVVAVSKKINGGVIGINERKALTAKYKKLLGV